MQTVASAPVLKASTDLTPADRKALSAALRVLCDHPVTRRQVHRLFNAGYKILMSDNLSNYAEHNPRSPINDQPNIKLQRGRTVWQYAESISHESSHIELALNGRIYGLELSPQGDMQQRLVEEAAVLAMTADLMYQLGHGENTISGAAYPELWKAHLTSSEYTGNQYAGHIEHGPVAAQLAAFEGFYSQPSQDRESYYAFSLDSLSKETHENRHDPNLFNRSIKPRIFADCMPPEFPELTTHIASRNLQSPTYFYPPAWVLIKMRDYFDIQFETPQETAILRLAKTAQDKLPLAA